MTPPFSTWIQFCRQCIASKPAKCCASSTLPEGTLPASVCDGGQWHCVARSADICEDGCEWWWPPPPDASACWSATPASSDQTFSCKAKVKVVVLSPTLTSPFKGTAQTKDTCTYFSVCLLSLFFWGRGFDKQWDECSSSRIKTLPFLTQNGTQLWQFRCPPCSQVQQTDLDRVLLAMVVALHWRSRWCHLRKVWCVVMWRQCSMLVDRSRCRSARLIWAPCRHAWSVLCSLRILKQGERNESCRH